MIYLRSQFQATSVIPLTVGGTGFPLCLGRFSVLHRARNRLNTFPRVEDLIETSLSSPLDSTDPSLDTLFGTRPNLGFFWGGIFWKRSLTFSPKKSTATFETKVRLGPPGAYINSLQSPSEKVCGSIGSVSSWSVLQVSSWGSSHSHTRRILQCKCKVFSGESHSIHYFYSSSLRRGFPTPFPASLLRPIDDLFQRLQLVRP